MRGREAPLSRPTRRAAALAAGLSAIVLGAASIAVAGAPSSPKSPTSKPSKTVGGQVEKSGGILVVSGLRGGEPQLTDEQDKRFLLTGPWRKELLRLGGHKVKVTGRLGKSKLMQPTIEVQRYEIVDSGAGRRPQVGMLHRGENDGLQLRTATVTLEVTANKTLRELLLRRVGCKVWILGELSGDKLKASKFGWLACTVNRSIKPNKETPR